MIKAGIIGSTGYAGQELVDAKCMDDNMDALADAADVIFTATPQGYVPLL